MEQTPSQPAKKNVIRLIYLYLVALIGLVVFLFGGVGLVNLGFKTLLGVSSDYYMQTPRDTCLARFGGYPYAEKMAPVPAPVTTPATDTTPKKIDENSDEFKNCVRDEETRQNKQQSNDRRRDIALALAQLFLGAPIWLYHWRVIQQDHRQSNS